MEESPYDECYQSACDERSFPVLVALVTEGETLANSSSCWRLAIRKLDLSASIVACLLRNMVVRLCEEIFIKHIRKQNYKHILSIKQKDVIS